MVDAKKLLTDDVRHAFLKDKQPAFAAFIAVALLGLATLAFPYLAKLILRGPTFDCNYIRKHGKVAFGTVEELRANVQSPIQHGVLETEVRYKFQVGGKHYEASRWIPAESAESNKGEGEEILILYDERDPNHCCLAHTDVPYQDIKEVLKRSGNLSSFNIQPLLPVPGTGIYYMLPWSFLVFFMAGAIMYFRITVKRLLANPDAVEGVVQEVKEVRKRRKVRGYEIKVVYEPRSGPAIEKEFSTSKKQLPESIAPGRKVNIIYSAAKPKSFFIYELYSGRPAEKSE